MTPRFLIYLVIALAGFVAAPVSDKAHAITITMSYSDEGSPTPHPENPAWDPAGTILKAHFSRAAQIWSQLLPGPGDFEFDFQWDNDIDGLGLATIIEPFDTFIEINPNYSWYADQYPLTDDEFNPIGTQLLASDLTPAERDNFFAGSTPPGALETGYHRQGLPGPIGPGGFDAQSGYDLLTVVVHEIGHVLGINSAHFPPKIVYGIDSQFLGGTGDALVSAGAGGHLAGDEEKPGYLMCDQCATAGGRYYPSATDVLAIAGVNGMSDVYLQRVGRISSGLWDEPNSWIGGDVPAFPQDAYITQGGTVTLTTDASANDLRVTTGNSLLVNDRFLHVAQTLSFDSATVSVAPGGRISATKIVRTGDDILTTSGSTIGFNEYVGGPSTSASFNGSVVVGSGSTEGGPITFHPTTIKTWNIAEQLAIDGASQPVTLQIDNKTKFTSGTGRVGGGGSFTAARTVSITGSESSWTVNGLLEVVHGSIDVASFGRLNSASTAVGSTSGRGFVTVDNAEWFVTGNLDVGPTAPSTDGQGTLTIKNNATAKIDGAVNIRGTTAYTSEVLVQSNARFNVGGPVTVGPNGRLTYGDSSYASIGGLGAHDIDNLGSDSFPGKGGVTRFTGNAIAGNSLFTPVYITNHAGTTTFADGGVTEFRDDSNAGGAIIENLRSFAAATAGATRFFDSSSAGNGTFFNAPGPLTYYATIEFNGNSSGGNGTFVNLPGVLNESVGGAIVFKNDSTAETGTYTSQGEGGTVTFNDQADADHGTFTTADNIGGNSRIQFFDDSTAGQATFSMGANTPLQFIGRSTAADATITARPGGYVQFSGDYTPSLNPTSTAANAHIDLEGATVPFAYGGHAGFSTYSTAGESVITANGGTVSNAAGATIAFDYAGHAGNATLIAKSGTNGGAGGAIYFRRAATGDTARIVVELGALADFGGNRKNIEFGYDGTTVGSIEGGGTFALNGSELRAGTRNIDTTVSGPIVDAPGTATDGRLTKIGTGKLTLNGTNTYTGLTTVSAGALFLNGSVVGNVQVAAGATFGGSGVIGGNLNVADGAILAPGNSPGTLRAGSLTLNPASILNFEFGVVSDLMIVAGDLTLDGVLNILPGLGFDAFGEEIITYGGTLTNNGLTIGAVPAGFTPADFQFDFSTPGEIHILGPTETVPGDYNFNGLVDAADYTLWRDNLGSANALPNDDSPGVGEDDYDRWKTNFGQAAGSGSGATSSASASTAVPEPAASLLLAVGLLAVPVHLRRRSTSPKLSQSSSRRDQDAQKSGAMPLSTLNLHDAQNSGSRSSERLAHLERLKASSGSAH